MYVTKFVLEEEDAINARKILLEIRKEDETFKFNIVKLKDGRYLLKIYSKDKDTAHKRGLWVRDRIFNNRAMYGVEVLK